MVYLLISFFVSFLGCLVFIRLGLLYDKSSGPQKLHTKPTPRAGGIAIFLSLLCVLIAFFVARKDFSKEFLLFLLSAFPVFLFGLLEDVSNKIAPKWRLMAGFISGALVVFLLSSSVTRIDFPYVDDILRYKIISLLFTSFAIAGVSHAFNIIDGLNGLVSGVSILVFGAYAYVSFLHNDFFLLYLSLIFVFSTLGFFLWNYPFGFIFLGDSGAYLLGFSVATIGVLLVNKHPDVSPWFPLLLVLYPIWETIFSIYRRKFLKRYSPYMPDALHFHQLLYRRLLKTILGSNIEPFKRNSYTSPFLWVMGLICLIPAVLFWNNTPVLMFFTLAFIVFYTWLYFRIVTVSLYTSPSPRD